MASLFSSKEAGLTLVGVGPGDPSLLTLAAVEAIQSATLVAYPIARIGAKGMALSIASKWIAKEKKLLPLHFPMVEDVFVRKSSWKEAGEQLAAAVSEGQRVVFLCQGDVSFFASSSYVLLELIKNHPKCQLRLIPGVTALSAAAAIGGWPLALQREQLLIVPTPDKKKAVENLLDESVSLGRVLALIKLGHRWNWIRPLLEKRDLLNNALFAQRVGFSDELVVKACDISASEKPYFSLLIIRKSWPDVIP